MSLGLDPRRQRSRRAAVLVLDVMTDFAFDGGPAAHGGRRDDNRPSAGPSGPCTARAATLRLARGRIG
jgi:hypothetical protein